MLNKLIPCLICGIVGIFVGGGLRSACKAKKEYFEDFEKYLQKYMSNLSFGKYTVIEFSKRYCAVSKLLDRQLKAVCASNKISDNQIPCGYLTKVEYNFANDTFISLGTKDGMSEKTVTQDRLDELKKFKSNAETAYNKVGKSYVKLGLLFGLLLGVLLL